MLCPDPITFIGALSLPIQSQSSTKELSIVLFVPPTLIPSPQLCAMYEFLTILFVPEIDTPLFSHKLKSVLWNPYLKFLLYGVGYKTFTPSMVQFEELSILILANKKFIP